jgi:hypothetical protein
LLDQAIGCRVPIPQSTAIDLAASVPMVTNGLSAISEPDKRRSHAQGK